MDLPLHMLFIIDDMEYQCMHKYLFIDLSITIYHCILIITVTNCNKDIFE
jgi:hypothetical protein